MKDFTEFSRTITEAHAKLKALEAECLKETGIRYDDKAFERACRYLEEATGSCPYFRELMRCGYECDSDTTEGWQCWMKYFRGKE